MVLRINRLALAGLLLATVPALAQDITNHAIPIGGGPGVVGWKVGGPCAAGQALVWQTGVNADPTCAVNGGSISATAPITANTVGTATTIGINLDSNFAVVSQNLALASIAAGHLLANSTSGSAEPTDSTLTALIDQAIGSTSGGFLQRNASWVVNVMSGDCTMTAAGAITCTKTNGVSYPSSVTSGGVLYASSTSAVASSGLLGTNQIVLGGGAGNPPTSLANVNGGMYNVSSGGTPSVTITPTLGVPGTNAGILGFSSSGNSNVVTFGAGTGSNAIDWRMPTSLNTGFAWVNSGSGALSNSTAVSLAGGGTGQGSAVAARQSSGLNIWGDAGTGHGDAGVTLGNTERFAYTTATFTASRAWVLPAAAVTGAPYTIQVSDMFGGVTGVNTLVITRAGADTINGGTTIAIAAAYGSYICSSDGSSKWNCQSTGPASAGGVTSVVCATTTITTTGTCYSRGQIVATNTNDNATTGNFGEQLVTEVLVGSAVAMSSGAAKTIATLSLTAGDWDVNGNVCTTVSGAATTAVVGTINTTTDTLPTSPNKGAYNLWQGSTTSILCLPTGTIRESLSGTTNIFLIGFANFTGGTMSGFGYIQARRVR